MDAEITPLQSTCAMCGTLIPLERLARSKKTVTCSDACARLKGHKIGRGIRYATSSPHCLHCGKAIPEAKRQQGTRFCDRYCRRDYRHDPSKEWDANATRATGAFGAAGEMLVAADLLTRGYAVFRSIFHNDVCDLVAHRGKGFVRVEVKHTTRLKSDPAGWPKGKKAAYRDVLAQVFGDGEIRYSPPLEQFD